jgi:hypothetical protein
MSITIESVNKVLEKYEFESNPFRESDVSQALKTLRDPQEAVEPPMQWIAEVMAFDFVEDCDNPWGTYFGPFITYRDGREWPSIRAVTGDTIAYWSTRAKMSKNPILRSRYSDLVWDFSRAIENTSPDYTMAQLTIDCITEIGRNKRHPDETAVIKKLGRALSLAIQLNDASRIETVRDAIFDYEDSITQGAKVGLRGFAYDLLYANDKVKLTCIQEEKLISDLEDLLSRTTEHSNLEPWAAQEAALRLAKHYRKIERPDEVKRVLTVLADAFKESAANAPALQASGQLQHLYGILINFGLTQAAGKISVQLRDLGSKVEAELKPISHTINISNKDMEKYIKAITQGEINQALSKIAWQYIPKRSIVETQLKDLAEKAPLFCHLTKDLLDKRGRSTSKVGALDVDPEGNMVRQMSQNILIESVFLRKVLDSLVEKNADFVTQVVEHIFRSPIFNLDRKTIVERGIKHYFDGDHLIAVHLLVPQIEEAIRLLVEKSDGSIMKPVRGGGFDLKTLDDLLRDPLTVRAIGEDTSFYLRVLLVDRRGWNIRNYVCHGIYSPNEFGYPMSDRVLHVLLCLAEIREEETT